MAYSTASPPRLLAAETNDGSTPRMWVYNSTDSVATISASGYISNATNLGMRVGDMVLCRDSTNTRDPVLLQVASIASGAATLGTSSAMTPGVGITGGTGTVYRSWTRYVGPNTIRTFILMDLTGLNSGGTAGDIIGTNGAGVAHLGQVTTAINGLVYFGQMTCIETPAGGDTDFDIFAATVATGVEDTAISGLTGQTQLLNAGVQAKGTRTTFTAWPAANAYLYLVGQGTSNAIYTAGQVLIELEGTTLT